jgi:methylated-DNA-[protein]-cysteine S-methyltransferase
LSRRKLDRRRRAGAVEFLAKGRNMALFVQGATMSQAKQSYCVFEVTGGFCGIAWNSAGITRLCLPVGGADAATQMLLRRVPASAPEAPHAQIAATIAAVQRYFRGETVDFSGVRLELAGQGEFHQRIYQALRKVGWGQTTTYGTLARELGAGAQAARAVGEAMARNPIPLIVPCHRVLAAGGELGGFSAPGGASTKMRMLELEGVRHSHQQSLF